MKTLLFLLISCHIILHADTFNDAIIAASKKNYQKALKLYYKTCNSGFAQGCTNLGVLYENGQGVKQNYAKAKAFYSKACDGDDQGGCEGYAILAQQGY